MRKSSFWQKIQLGPLRSIITYIRYKMRLPRDQQNIDTTIESVKSGANLTGANLWVLVTAIFMASLGLNVNSTAVIIGAMLISPLMGPIMGIGMGVAMHDFPLVYRSLKNFLLSVLLSIVTSSVYFFISPLKVPGSELLARTSPTVYDVLIAVFGGLAGIIAGSSKLRQSNVIPGVAIATALMPPLCTVGFGIANLNPTYIVGAFYLFFINSVFISLATYFIVRILQYPYVEQVQERRALRIRRIIWSVVIVALVPSVYLTFKIVKRYIFEERAKQFVAAEFSGKRRVVLQMNTNLREKKPHLELTLLGPEIDTVEMMEINKTLSKYGLDNVVLDIKQGFGDVTRRGQLISSISEGIENNSRAINEIFVELDSMRRGIPKMLVVDSLQAQIAKETVAWMPALLTIRVSPYAYYSVPLAKNREGWLVRFEFQGRQNQDELTKLKRWLETKLPGDTLITEFVVR